jgi:hypothetical protein
MVGILSKLVGKGLTRKALGASRKARKSKGKKAADLMTPSSVAKPMSQGESKLKGTGTPTSGDIPAYRVTVANQNKKGKNLTKTMKDLEEAKKKLKVYEEKRDSLKGIDKTKFIAKKSKQITKDKENIKLLKSKIKNMKDRDIVPKMGGGKVIKKSRGGKSMRGGLNLAEKTLRNREDNIKRKKLTKPKILKEMDSYKKQETYGEYLDAPDPPPKKKRKSSGSYGKAALGGVTEKDLFYGLKETGSSNTKKQGSKNKPIRLKKPKEGKSDSSVTVDYTVIDKLKSGGKVKGYKKGGPITYRMTGGQVVDNSYD